MTCREFQEAASAWALGALDVDEATACEAHLREPRHDGCADALARAAASVAAMDAALPPLLSAFADIDGRLRLTEARPRARIWPTVAIAAVVLLALIGLARERERVAAEQAAMHERHVREQTAMREQHAASVAERDRCERELRALRDRAGLPREVVALLEQPATRITPMLPQPGRTERATAVMNLAAGRAFIVSSTGAPPAGKDLQLWVIRGKGAPVPAGFLRAGEGGVLVGEVDRAVLSAGAPDALAVSLEPAGGRPTPTEVVLVGVLGG